MNANIPNSMVEPPIASPDSTGAFSSQFQDTVRQTQNRFGEMQNELVDRTKYAAQTTDAYVHENPWGAVCAAVTIGFVAGLILGRR